MSRSPEPSPRPRVAPPAQLAMGALVLGALGSGAPSCCTLEWSSPLDPGTTPTTTASAPPVPLTPEQRWACRATGSHQAEATSAAQAAILGLPSVIQPDELEELGFHSPDDLVHAAAGLPFCVFTLPIPALAAYSPDKPLREQLVELHALYPIEVSNDALSGMIIEPGPPAPDAGDGQPQSGAWQATAYGGPRSIERFTKARRRLAQQRGLPPSRFFIVEIPGLDLAYVAFEDEASEVRLTATTAEIPEKVPSQARDEVLKSLKALVQKPLALDKPPLDN